MATTIAANSWMPRRRSGVATAFGAPGRAFSGYRRRNPELAKALGHVQRYVAEGWNLLDLDDQDAPLRTVGVRQRSEDLLTRDLKSLSIDSAWDLANELKQELLFLGDVSYVWTQLEYEAQRDKKPNMWHRWSDHLEPTKLQALLAARRSDGAVDRPVQLDAVRSLKKLYELRAEAGMERRARAAQKFRYLTLLIPILFSLLLALSAAIYEVGGAGMWKMIALGASAGALGATLSGIFRVRDRLVELDDLRSFWPAMRIQPLIGATAGLFTLLVLESHAVKLADDAEPTPWAAWALFTFVAGFSEPFFLGLVRRVAVVPDKDATLSSPERAHS
jgi:hypothetical protein